MTASKNHKPSRVSSVAPLMRMANGQLIGGLIWVIGELANVGAAPALPNAVFHATWPLCTGGSWSDTLGKSGQP